MASRSFSGVVDLGYAQPQELGQLSVDPQLGLLPNASAS
jgi:hypothetical protein